MRHGALIKSIVGGDIPVYSIICRAGNEYGHIEVDQKCPFPVVRSSKLREHQHTFREPSAKPDNDEMQYICEAIENAKVKMM